MGCLGGLGSQAWGFRLAVPSLPSSWKVAQDDLDDLDVRPAFLLRIPPQLGLSGDTSLRRNKTEHQKKRVENQGGMSYDSLVKEVF